MRNEEPRPIVKCGECAHIVAESPGQFACGAPIPWVAWRRGIDFLGVEPTTVSDCATFVPRGSAIEVDS